MQSKALLMSINIGLNLPHLKFYHNDVNNKLLSFFLTSLFKSISHRYRSQNLKTLSVKHEFVRRCLFYDIPHFCQIEKNISTHSLKGLSLYILKGACGTEKNREHIKTLFYHFEKNYSPPGVPTIYQININMNLNIVFFPEQS